MSSKPGLCRLCGSLTKHRILNEKYRGNGGFEVYKDMVMDCFGLEFSNLEEIEPHKKLICALCVMKLRDTWSFKKQVEKEVKTYSQDAGNAESSSIFEVKRTLVLIRDKPVCVNGGSTDPLGDPIESIIKVEPNTAPTDTQPNCDNRLSADPLQIVKLKSLLVQAKLSENGHKKNLNGLQVKPNSKLIEAERSYIIGHETKPSRILPINLRDGFDDVLNAEQLAEFYSLGSKIMVSDGESNEYCSDDPPTYHNEQMNSDTEIHATLVQLMKQKATPKPNILKRKLNPAETNPGIPIVIPSTAKRKPGTAKRKPSTTKTKTSDAQTKTCTENLEPTLTNGNNESKNESVFIVSGKYANQVKRLLAELKQSTGGAGKRKAKILPFKSYDNEDVEFNGLLKTTINSNCGMEVTDSQPEITEQDDEEMVEEYLSTTEDEETDQDLENRKSSSDEEYVPEESELEATCSDGTLSDVEEKLTTADEKHVLNSTSIVVYSYACPFKSSFNHIKCYYCAQYFLDPGLLREHTMTHSPREFHHKDLNYIKLDITRIDCRRCSEKINTVEDFADHIRKVHKKKYFPRHKDGVIPFKLVKHENNCCICGENCPSFNDLDKHTKQHFANYMCESCGLGFLAEYQLEEHMSHHEGKKYICDYCSRSYLKKSYLKYHIRRVHTKRKVSKFSQKSRSFACYGCDKKFKHSRNRQLHIRAEHMNLNRYECKICGYKTVVELRLKRHMVAHTGERNFKCDECGKCLATRSSLKYHMKTHTNDRKFTCHVCGTAFVQNGSLTLHMKNLHHNNNLYTRTTYILASKI